MEASLRHKLNKKLKLSFGKSKNSKEENKKAQRSNINADKLYAGNWKSKVKDKKAHYAGQDGSGSEVYGKGKLEHFSSDRKRKRIYGDQNVESKPTNNKKAPNNKGFLKKGQRQVKGDPIKGKNSYDPLRSIWASRRLEAAVSETKWPSHRVKDTVGSEQRSSGKWSTKMKEADNFDGDGNGLLKKHTKNKSDRSMSLDQSRRKCPDVSSSNSAKKTVQNKKGFADDDSEAIDDQPNKRKRIRLDPHDISNKRLDDGIVTDGKNYQFTLSAICMLSVLIFYKIYLLNKTKPDT